jgi:hypothetical protein
MPQFYFHLWRGGELTSDEVGADLPTLNAAKCRAERIASSILDQNDGVPLDRSGWDIEVTDAAGRTFLIVPVNPEGLTTQPNRAA